MSRAIVHRAPLVLLIVTAISLSAGMLAARSPQAAVTLSGALVAVGALALIRSVPVETLFLGWLFLAPLFQEAAEHSTVSIGAPLTLVLYVIPAIALTALTAFSRRRGVSLTAVDYLPLAFLAYVLVSVITTSDALQTTPKFVFATVVLGPVMYYFIRSGPGAGIPPEKIVATLLLAAIVQGALSIVDYATKWNPWNRTGWQEGVHADFPRAVATLGNPGVLGMFLGVAIVCAVAILTWDGPESRRRLARWTIAICVPGLLVTLTRAPILATLAAVLLVLMLGRWRLATVGAVTAAAVLLVVLLPTLRQTDLYQERFTDAQTISHRGAIQEWSLQLAAEKPILGWGYNSFDEAKNAAQFDVDGTNIDLILGFTSHNTYVTALVELGGVGLVLLGLPFVVLGVAALARVRVPAPDRWLLVASLASIILTILTALTFDLRFFSFAQLLPWMFLAMLRTHLARPVGSGTDHGLATRSDAL